jgi:hypothetical protein
MRTKQYVYAIVDRATDRKVEAVCLSRAEARLWLKITAPAFPFQKFRIMRARMAFCE